VRAGNEAVYQPSHTIIGDTESCRFLPTFGDSDGRLEIPRLGTGNQVVRSMTDILQNILVCVDHHRRDGPTRHNAIALAKRFATSLRITYVVDFKDLQVFAAGPPSGEAGRWVFTGTPRETQLAAEGREELKRFRSACKNGNVEHHVDLFVGSSEMIWAEEARLCDLAMIVPVEEDFCNFERCFGSMFWRIAVRSCRPVLLFRRNELPRSRMALFYTNRVGSARALPYVNALCSLLETPLTVYTSKARSRDYVRADECRAFLDCHEVCAEYERKDVSEVLITELKHPGSQLEEPSLLVFDRGLCKGPWFRQHRRAVEQLIRTSPHWILLCP